MTTMKISNRFPSDHPQSRRYCNSSSYLNCSKSWTMKRDIVKSAKSCSGFKRGSGVTLVNRQKIIESKVLKLNSHAITHFAKGDFRTASSLFQKAASLQRSVYANTTSALSNQELMSEEQKNIAPPVSSYMYQRMDFDEGMHTYVDTEPVRSGDHPKALEATLLFNAGQARRKLEDFAAAEGFYNRALHILIGRNVLTSQPAVGLSVHHVVIPILHNLGLLFYRKGELEKSIACYKLALDHCRKLMGKEDHSVGIALNCLGVLYHHLQSGGESNQAIECFNEALKIQAHVLGLKSTNEATTLNNLGRVHAQHNNLNEALACYERALEIRKKLLGSDNLDYAATAFNVGQTLHQQHEHDRAIYFYEEFLRVARIKFPKYHRDIALVLSGMAQIHQERKEYDKALTRFEESLEIGRGALGEYHSELAMLFNRLGNFHFTQENLGKALEAYSEGLRIERKLLDKTDPNLIVTMCNIAKIYRRRNEFDPAICLYTEAVELQKSRYGHWSAEVARTMNIIGLIFEQSGDSLRALEFLHNSLIIRRKVLGEDHIEVASTLTNLGTIFRRRNRILVAMQLFDESLQIRLEKQGKDHRDVSFALYNLGLCHHSQGSFKEAIKCYRETLRIELLRSGENHRDVSMTLYKLGEAYKANGDLDQALSSFEACLRIERRNVNNSAVVARLLNEIGNIHLVNDDIVPMMEALNEAARIYESAGLSAHNNLATPGGQLYAFDMSCPSAAPVA